MLGLLNRLLDFRSPTRQEVSRYARRGMDLGLFGCLVLTPLALGGRHDLGRFVYAASVALATLAMASGALLTGSRLRLPRVPLLIGFAAICLVALQLIPLPSALLSVLAPGHSELLTAWGPETPLGVWRTISLAPAETVEGLAILAAHVLLFIVVVNRVDQVADLRRLLAWVACGATGMALLAVLQRALPSERLLWFYDYPSQSFASNLQGSFSNRNHLANFLIFGIAAASAFVVRTDSSRRHRKASAGIISHKVGVLALVVMTALIAVSLGTQSRGGLIALGAGLVAIVAIRWRGGQVRLPELLVTAGVATAALLAVSMFDYDRVTSRLDDLVSGEVEQLDANNGRRLIWGANLRALANNPWMGHGAGTHRHVYPAYIEGGASTEFTHAESSYLQIGTENGAAGLLLLATAAAVLAGCFYLGTSRAVSAEQVAIWAALGTGLASSFAHSVVDFVWYIPALAALAITFAAGAWRLVELQSQTAQEPRRRGSQQAGWLSPWAGACSAAAGASFCLACLWGPAAGAVDWDQYRRASKTAGSLMAKRYSMTEEALDPHLGSSIDDASDRAVRSLEVVVNRDPRNAVARSRLASRYQRVFERRVAAGGNPMTIDSIRDAALNGGFENAEARVAWIRRAFGEASSLLFRAREQALMAVRLSPLQAESYLQLSRLAFLSDWDTSDSSLIAQAVRLHPHDGGVRYEAGRQRHLMGDVHKAYEHYEASLRLPGSHRRPLAASLASSSSASWLIEKLEPDYAATELLINVYHLLDSHEDLVTLAQHAEQAAQSQTEGMKPKEQAYRWRQVSIVNRSLGMPEKAVECASRAYELLPVDFWVRYELAAAFVAADRWTDADTHLRWCYSRRPDIRRLETWLREASKSRLRAERDSSRAPGSYLSLAKLPSQPVAQDLAPEPVSTAKATQP